MHKRTRRHLCQVKRPLHKSLNHLRCSTSTIVVQSVFLHLNCVFFPTSVHEFLDVRTAAHIYLRDIFINPKVLHTFSIYKLLCYLQLRFLGKGHSSNSVAISCPSLEVFARKCTYMFSCERWWLHDFNINSQTSRVAQSMSTQLGLPDINSP